MCLTLKNHNYAAVVNAIIWITIHRIKTFLGMAVLCIRSVVSYLSRTWSKKEGSGEWEKDLGELEPNGIPQT